METLIELWVSYILIINWTMLQVSVAVLLDNFVSETAREKEIEADMSAKNPEKKIIWAMCWMVC